MRRKIYLKEASMTDLLDRLRLEMTAKGYALRMVSGARIAELEQETAGLYAKNLIAPLLHDKYLKDGYDFGVLRRSPLARSLQNKYLDTEM